MLQCIKFSSAIEKMMKQDEIHELIAEYFSEIKKNETLRGKNLEYFKLVQKKGRNVIPFF